MDRERAREYVNAQPPTFLEEAKSRGYVCPVCGNGSGATGDGIAKDPTDRAGTHYKCFKCGLYADTIELYGKAQGIADYNTQLQEAARYYGVTVDSYHRERATAREDFAEYQNPPENERYTHTSIHTDTAAGTEAAPQDFTPFYRECNSRLQETDYHTRRGLSAETCNRFLVGYAPAWKHPKAPSAAPASPRLIVPISRYSYLARDTREELTEQEGKYKKSKVKGAERVTWIFNARSMQTATKPVYVVEGEIDAMSVIEAGGEAVAIGSTAYTRAFLTALEAAAPAHPLIIALDNDPAGEKAAEELEAGLYARSIPFYRYNPAAGYKDANAALVADRTGLAAKIAEGEALALEAAEREQEERREEYLKANSAAAHLQGFIDGITESVNTPYIPTGFTKLDDVLDGGLYEGLYVCGAISSLGKTTLIAQIADQIAQSGQDVLYFSLEMARSEIMAKSISRHTLQEVLAGGGGGDIRNAKTTRGITTGRRYANYSRTERELIQTAIEQYAGYAGHIFITEGIGDIGAAQIRETIQAHIAATGNTPVIVLDYLQILAPYNERATDKQNTDKNVMELKRISRDYKTPVIAISSFNRENYKNAVTMEAFKESGAVEYSSDVLIGLQLAGAGGKDFDANAEKKKNPRNVELVILKNRNGATGEKIAYTYYPLFNYFTEI